MCVKKEDVEKAVTAGHDKLKTEILGELSGKLDSKLSRAWFVLTMAAATGVISALLGWVLLKAIANGEHVSGITSDISNIKENIGDIKEALSEHSRNERTADVDKPK